MNFVQWKHSSLFCHCVSVEFIWIRSPVKGSDCWEDFVTLKSFFLRWINNLAGSVFEFVFVPQFSPRCTCLTHFFPYILLASFSLLCVSYDSFFWTRSLVGDKSQELNLIPVSVSVLLNSNTSNMQFHFLKTTDGCHWLITFDWNTLEWYNSK